jgi:hypothetical protein
MQQNIHHVRLLGSGGNYGKQSYKPCVAVAAFDDCFYIACDFVKIAFEHVPREANVIAMN